MDEGIGDDIMVGPFMFFFDLRTFTTCRVFIYVNVYDYKTQRCHFNVSPQYFTFSVERKVNKMSPLMSVVRTDTSSRKFVDE